MNRPADYFRRIGALIATAAKGLGLTFRYFRKNKIPANVPGISDPEYFKRASGPVTIQYPFQKIPVPTNGRYRLYMETDDCIGCDKCARICPVDCITIETFRADGDLGKTSDGTVKRLHLPVFDIDMGKCMFCGLCTTVCPTECLYMTPVFDYSEFDRDNLVYHFGAYSPQDEDRIRKETEIAITAKKQAVQKPATQDSNSTIAPPRKPVMKPLLKKPVPPSDSKTETPLPNQPGKPVMKKPVIPPKPKDDKEGGE